MPSAARPAPRNSSRFGEAHRPGRARAGRDEACNASSDAHVLDLAHYGARFYWHGGILKARHAARRLGATEPPATAASSSGDVLLRLLGGTAPGAANWSPGIDALDTEISGIAEPSKSCPRSSGKWAGCCSQRIRHLEKARQGLTVLLDQMLGPAGCPERLHQGQVAKRNRAAT